MTNQVVPISEGSAAVAETGAHVAPEKAAAKKASRRQKGAPQSQKRVKAAKPAAKARKASKPKRQTKTTGSTAVARQGTAKAKVIALLSRKGGASLEEIRKATDWQAHTVQGFISLLGSKGGYMITSSRREDGAREYAIQV